ADAVHGLHGADLFLKEHAAGDREVLDEVAHLDQRLAVAAVEGAGGAAGVGHELDVLLAHQPDVSSSPGAVSSSPTSAIASCGRAPSCSSAQILRRTSASSRQAT